MKQLITKIDKQFLGRLCADAISNLQKACEKHPTFPMNVSGLTLEAAEGMLRRSRQANDEPDRTVCMIANEEELEMEVAILQGMRPQVYDELVDLITVWLRVGLHLTDYVHSNGADLQPPLQTFTAPPVEVKPFIDAAAEANPSFFCNDTLRSAMRNVVEAFDKLSLKRKGESCIHGCACLRHNLNQKEEVQLAAVDEAYKGIGAPGDWGYNSEQGATWYQLLVLCSEIAKRRKAVQP
jgi:hypothetical protein